MASADAAGVDRRMKLLRVIAVLLALTLMFGEAFRSWGAGRPFFAWFDDQIMGALLILGAWLMAYPTPRRHAFFAMAWGVNTGMLYGSFFGKLYNPESSNPGNFDIAFLTIAIGLLFVIAIAGTICSILLTPKTEGGTRLTQGGR